jgi:hypothetical protein
MGQKGWWGQRESTPIQDLETNEKAGGQRKNPKLPYLALCVYQWMKAGGVFGVRWECHCIRTRIYLKQLKWELHKEDLS